MYVIQVGTYNAIQILAASELFYRCKKITAQNNFQKNLKFKMEGC
jgi:hypothetical protein